MKEFEELNALRLAIIHLFNEVKQVADKTNDVYRNYIELHKQQKILDSFYFQNKLLDVEFKSIETMYSYIDNRIYCDYYKLCMLIVRYVKELGCEISIHTYPVYRDLEPTKPYSFQYIQDLQHDLNQCLVIIQNVCDKKDENIKIHISKLQQGMNIDNYIHVLDYDKNKIKNQLDLYNKYIQSYHKYHITWLTQFREKLLLLQEQLHQGLNETGVKSPVVIQYCVCKQNIAVYCEGCAIELCKLRDTVYHVDDMKDALDFIVTPNIQLEVPIETPVVEVPVEEVPVEEVPVEEVPVEAPVEEVPVEASVEEVPVEAPVEEVPVEEVPVEEVPVEEVPVEEAPVEEVLVVEAPVEEVPVVEVPVESPVEEVPVEAPVEEVPVEAPVEEVPVEAPVEEVPVVEVPVESPVVEVPVESPVVEAPVEEVPVVEAPVKEVPVEEVPVEAPVEEVPVEAPVVEVPVEAPVEEVPVIEAPVEEASVKEVPVVEVLVEEAPVEEVLVDEAPVEEAPVEEAPVEEASVDEAPVKESSVDEAPVESVPVESASVESAPVESAPVESAPVDVADDPIAGDIPYDVIYNDVNVSNLIKQNFDSTKLKEIIQSKMIGKNIDDIINRVLTQLDQVILDIMKEDINTS
jgi:hypothetical protein